MRSDSKQISHCQEIQIKKDFPHKRKVRDKVFREKVGMEKGKFYFGLTGGLDLFLGSSEDLCSGSSDGDAASLTAAADNTAFASSGSAFAGDATGGSSAASSTTTTSSHCFCCFREKKKV